MGSELSRQIEQLNLVKGDSIVVKGTFDGCVYGGALQVKPETVDLLGYSYGICDFVKDVKMGSATAGLIGKIAVLPCSPHERICSPASIIAEIENENGEFVPVTLQSGEFQRPTQKEIEEATKRWEITKQQRILKKKEELFDLCINEMSKEQLAAAMRKILDLTLKK